MPPRDEKGSFEVGDELMKAVPHFFSKYKSPWLGLGVSEAWVGGIILHPLFQWTEGIFNSYHNCED